MHTFSYRLLRGVAAAAVLFGAVPNALAFDTFTDVPTTSEFHDNINALYTKGIIGGVTSTRFEPMRNMSRGEVTKVVVRAKGMPINTTGGPHFGDVLLGSTFYEYIETLMNANVISGFSDGKFRPEWPVSRGEFSKIVTRTWNMPVDLTNAPHFDDMGETSPSFQYVETLFNNGIINGYPDGTFHQDNKILRQEVAKMVDRVMNKIAFNTGTGARIAVLSSTETAVANCNAQISFTATSFDRFGNVDAVNTASVTATSTVGTFTSSGTSSETASFANGTANFQLRSCQPGTVTVVATSGTQTGRDTATFTSNPSQPTNTFSITANPTSITADCTTASTVSFSVRDAQGNTLTSFTDSVTATITGPGRFITSGGNAGSSGTIARTVSAVSGAGTFMVAACAPGASTVSFQSGNVQNGSTALTFSASPSTTPTSVVVAPNSCLQIGAASPTSYTLTVNNGSGSALANAGVTITSTGDPNVLVAPSGSQLTNGLGQLTFTLSSPTGSAAGMETLNVAVTPVGAASPTVLTTGITVQAAAC